MKSPRIAPVLMALAVAAPVPAVADGGDARALMAASYRRLEAPDETLRYRMELLEGGRVVHTRELQRFAKVMPDRRATVVRFTSPAAVKGVSLLIEDTGAAVNDIWSYTPATRTLRRVAGSQKQNWFMGTEYTFEDFEDYKLQAYAFTHVETLAPCRPWGARCNVVDARPTASDEMRASGYSRKRYVLEEESLYPVRIDYFDREGRHVKRLEVEGLRRIGDYARPASQTMTNLTNDRATRMVVTEQKLATGVDASVFTQRFLRSDGD
jgi:hypothetical protein